MCHMKELAFYPEETGKGTEGLGTPEYHSEVAFQTDLFSGSTKDIYFRRKKKVEVRRPIEKAYIVVEVR